MKRIFLILVVLLLGRLYASEVEDKAYLEECLISLNRFKTSGEYQKAFNAAKAAVALSKKIEEEYKVDQSSNLAALYLSMAELELRHGNKEASLMFFEKIASLRAEAMPSSVQRNLTIFYNHQATDALKKLNYPRAVLFQQKAVELAGLLLGNESVDYAVLQDKLGTIYYKMGAYQKALESTKQAYELISKSNDKQNILIIESNLGTYYAQVGAYEKALYYQLNAMKRAEVLWGKVSTEIASIYSVVAYSYLRQGEYNQANIYLDQAMSIKMMQGIEDESLIKMYTHKGFIYQELGNSDEALKFYQKALCLSKKGISDDSTLSTALYNNLAQLYIDRAEVDKALEYYQKILETIDKDHPNSAFIYANIGSLQIEMKSYRNALHSVEKSIEMKKKFLGENHPSLASGYNSLSTIHGFLSQNDKALKYAKEALKILQINGLDGHHNMTEGAYGNMAVSYHALGDTKKAYQAVEQAISQVAVLRERAYTITSQKEKLHFKHLYDTTLEGYMEYAYLYAEMLKGEEKQVHLKQVFKTLFELRHTISNEWESFSVLASHSSDDEVKKHFESLLQNQRLLARTYQKNVESKEAYDEREKERKILEASISQSEIFLSKKLRDTTLTGGNKRESSFPVVKELKEDTLFVVFFRGLHHYYRMSIDAQNRLKMHRYTIEISQEIGRRIKELQQQRQKIANKEKFADLEAGYKAYGALFELLFDRMDIADKKQLYFLLDGLLYNLPFEALYDKVKDQYLFETHRIHYFKEREHFKKNETEKRDIVVFANPDYERGSEKVSETRGELTDALKANFGALKGSKKEALLIKKLFPNAAIYLEENATEERLLGLNSPSILHIATHGFFLNENISSFALNRTGLLLSGANPSIREHRGEGIVTGMELSGLPLSGTELVVLSSCYGGLGEIENGEGVAHLANAFKRAGAKQVLMSLWSVEDEISAKMMGYFYEAVQQNDSYEEALRKAKFKLIEEGFVHPYYWANYVLYGGE